ncbi:hypothetical protein TNCV_3056181 [Trichonephila clavipes]|nr:hypothetical protein TNCV_3056181 [Trichonephila clavipes]
MSVPRVSTCGIGRDVSDQVGENVHIKVQKKYSNRLFFHSTGTSRTPDSQTPGSRTAAHVLMEKKKNVWSVVISLKALQFVVILVFRCCLNPVGVLPILVHDARSSISASTSLTKSAKLQKIKKTLSPRETILVMKPQLLKKNKTWPFVTAVEDSKHQPSTPLTAHKNKNKNVKKIQSISEVPTRFREGKPN